MLGHDFKKMGLRGDQIDHVTYQNCSHPIPQTFHAVSSPCIHPLMTPDHRLHMGVNDGSSYHPLCVNPLQQKNCREQGSRQSKKACMRCLHPV